MKTTMKQLAAGTILALLLMVGNVRAEGKDAKVASSLESVEPAMQLENWMMDSNIWNGTSAVNFDEETDESLQLEDWMINNANWDNTKKIDVKTEKESVLKLEDWMTNSSVWNR